jgi:hypothetical protein
MRKLGRKGRENIKAVKAGDKNVEGITRCELRLFGCTGGWNLTRAHRRKRRDCDKEELGIFALACPNCHAKVEAMPHSQMFVVVDAAIKRRGSY